jgi:hypothetical protein
MSFEKPLKADNYSYITPARRVNTYKDLPLASASAGQLYLVLNTVGIYTADIYTSDGSTWIGGAAAATVTDFSDADFSIYNDTDNTKVIEFDASSIGTGETKTVAIINSFFII